MRTGLGWLIIGLLLAGGGFLVARQRIDAAQLQSECELLRGDMRELARLRAENQRLTLAAPTADKLAELRAGHAAVAALRAKNNELRAQIDAAERERAEKKSRPPGRFQEGVAMPAKEWRNAGAGTPEAALETALWAAAGGDVEALARGISLAADARGPAHELLATVPDAMRAQFNTPEQLIAFLTIKDVPTGEAKVRTWHNANEYARIVEFALTGSDGRGKEVRLIVMRPPGTADWKLSVQASTVAKLAAALKDPAAASSR
jgi:hypothetical protein